MVDIVEPDPNSHITEYLNYYCNAENDFGFGVLLNGAWGSGKTHFIKNYKEKRELDYPQSKILFVTLYGVSSTDQIDDQLFAQLHPVLGSKGARILGVVAKHVIKGAFRFNIDEAKDALSVNISAPDISISKYAVRPSDTIIIFDDLERCSLPISEVLGYINSFIEHEKLKIVIIANEDEILKKDGSENYLAIKEKIIGKTFGVRSNTASALRIFIDRVSNARSRDILHTIEKTVILLYEESETKNLRILQQSLMEADRVLQCLEENHVKNEAVVKSIVSTVLAFSFEIRAARISQDHVGLFNRNTADYSLLSATGISGVIDKLKQRYPDLFEQQFYIEGLAIKQILYDGFVDRDNILNEINSHPPFRRVVADSNLKQIASIWDINDEQFEGAVAAFAEEFRNHKFIEPAELFQAFGAKFFLSEVGIISDSGEEIILQCKNYIDELATQGNIKNKFVEESYIAPGVVWEGFIFRNFADSNFAKIFEYYKTIVERVALDALPSEALRLLQVMQENTIEFHRMLCVNNVSQSVFHNVPILATVDPNVFVDFILALGPRRQNNVMTTLWTRYEPSAWQTELASEKPWLAEVKRILDHKIASLKPLSRFRMTNAINRYLVPRITDVTSENDADLVSQTLSRLEDGLPPMRR